MFIVATPSLLALEPGLFMGSGTTLRGFCTNLDEAHGYLSTSHLDQAPAEERIHRCRWVLRWQDITELSAIEPWPSIRISWRTGPGSDTRTLTPSRRWFGDEPSADELQREEVVDSLFDHMKVLGVSVPGDPGWTAVEHVPWEEIEEWPDTQSGDGGYRTAGVELILASRSKPTSLEFLFAWWASGPRQPWKMTARDVAVTRHYVYAHLADGRTSRLPLVALRDRWVSPRGDRIYEFGRRTRLVLPVRDECAVTRMLDELLDASEPSA